MTSLPYSPDLINAPDLQICIKICMRKKQQPTHKILKLKIKKNLKENPHVVDLSVK